MRRRLWFVLGAVGLAVVLAFAFIAVTGPFLRPFQPVPGETYGDRSMLDDVAPVVYEGSKTTVTSSLRSFGQTVWITPDDAGLVVDSTPVTCHGGMAHVIWHIGNLEPVVADTGLHLVARLDGEPIGGLLRGTTVGSLGDEPAAIHALTPCSVGEHVVDLQIRVTDGAWGFPYVVGADKPAPTDLVLNRGFVITETWASSP